MKWPMPNVVLAVMLIIPLVAYIGGYFWLCRVATGTLPGSSLFTDRQYGQPWMVVLFKPAGWLESRLRHRVVYLDSPSANLGAIEFNPYRRN
jgi:hypothetical protein